MLFEVDPPSGPIDRFGRAESGHSSERTVTKRMEQASSRIERAKPLTAKPARRAKARKSQEPESGTTRAKREPAKTGKSIEPPPSGKKMTASESRRRRAQSEAEVDPGRSGSESHDSNSTPPLSDATVRRRPSNSFDLGLQEPPSRTPNRTRGRSIDRSLQSQSRSTAARKAPRSSKHGEATRSGNRHSSR